MDWRIELRASAKSSLKQLSGSLRREILEEILDLRLDPFPAGAIRIAGLKGIFRLRLRGYRVIYRVTPGGKVIIERIRRRAEAYRGFPSP